MDASVMPMMTGGGDVLARIERYKTSKAVTAGACIACVAATILIGFTWGGWVTGHSAAAMADRAAIGGQARLAGAICADRFLTGSNARAQTALLEKSDPWRRGEFLVQGGWLTLAGVKDPVAGAADLCIRQILHG